MTDYSEWTMAKARELLPGLTKGHQANLLFISGDHWQAGEGWVGPMLASGEAGYADAMDRVHRGFISRNVLGEVVDTHTAGVVGRQPHISISTVRPLEPGEEPTADEQERIQEAEALLDGWWDANRALAWSQDGASRLIQTSMHDLLQDGCRTLLATTRAAFRIVIDPAVRVEGEDGESVVPDFATPEEAMDSLFVMHPRPEESMVHIDPDDLDVLGMYLYSRERRDEGDARDRLELVYLLPDGSTQSRLLEHDQEVALSDPFALGGRLTIYEMNRDEFLPETMRRLQRAYNLALTLMSRNLVSGGFLERLFLNASKPGDWEFDTETQTWKHTPADNIKLGEGTTNFLYGVPIFNEDGGISGFTNPSVHFRDPAPSDTFTKALDRLYMEMLAETSQLHTLISGDATASGESRVQAKSGFKNSLRKTKPAVDSAMRWLYETLLALAADLSGAPGRFDSIRVTVDSQLDVGIATGTELTGTIEAMEAQLLSQSAAMRRIGVEDTAAMSEQIEADVNTLLMWLKQKAEVAQTFGILDVNMKGVLSDVLGFSDEVVQALLEGETIPSQQRGLPDEQTPAGEATEEEAEASEQETEAGEEAEDET